MERVILHLQRCLFEYPCVVVPKLGAFILHEHQSEENSAEGYLYPSSASLTFNPQLQVADGLLAQSYMQYYRISFRKASSMLQKDIDELLMHLHQQPSIQLGELGRLKRGSHGGTPIFEPNEKHPFHIVAYGLHPLSQLPKLVRDAVGTREMEENKIYIPVNLKFVKVAATIVLFFGIISLLPFRNINDNLKEYQAGFVPEILQKKQEPAPSSKQEQIPIKEELVPESSNKQLAGLTCEQDFPENTYIIVVASLSSEKQVEAFVKQYELDTHSEAGVNKHGSHYRVYIGAYDNKTEAYTKAQEVRKYRGCEDAWVYRTKK